MNKTFDEETKDAMLAEKQDVMRFFEESTKSTRESLSEAEKQMVAIADYRYEITKLQHENRSLKDEKEKQLTAITDYRTQVTKLQHENSSLKDQVHDLADENTRYRDGLKQDYLAKHSMDKENLGDEHQKVMRRESENVEKPTSPVSSSVLVLQHALAHRDNQIRNQNETIEDLRFEITRVTKFFQKPHVLVRENELLKEKIDVMEKLNHQRVDTNMEFQQKLDRSEFEFRQDLQFSEIKFQKIEVELKDQLEQVKAELEGTNEQIGMLVEQHEREKEQARKELLAEVEQKEKYIVELEQTIQTLKEW